MTNSLRSPFRLLLVGALGFLSVAFSLPGAPAAAATVVSTETITIPGYVDGQRGSVEIAPNGTFAYASILTRASIGGAITWKLARIDLSTNTVISTIVTPFEVTSIAFTDDSAYAYVAGGDGTGNKIAKYRTSDGDR